MYTYYDILTRHDALPTTLNTASAMIGAAFFCPMSSPDARKAWVRTARSPASDGPPAGVGIVLQYQLYEPSDQSGQAIAHSARPCSPGNSCRPTKGSAVAHSRGPNCSSK